MNIAFAVSHKDATKTTELWAKFLVALGGLKEREIRIGFSREVDETYRNKLEAILKPACRKVRVFVYQGKDPGYPAGANKLFCMVMRGIKKPTLWIEPDLVPMRRFWIEDIEQEYAACGKPFLGPILKIWDTPHMNGTAVYPVEWESLSEGTIVDCPDIQPWDTNSRKKVVPHAATSKTMFHSFKHLSLPRDFADLNFDHAFLHPCKDGSLLDHANTVLRLLPQEWFAFEPEYYLIRGFSEITNRLPNARRVKMAGVNFGVTACTTRREIALAKTTLGCQRISLEEYQKLTA